MQKISSVNELVMRWGNSLSTALLDPVCTIFSTPGINGVIGYRNKLNCWIVYGDPVCAPSDSIRLAQAFDAYCKSQGKKAIYVCVSAQFANWALENICSTLIKIGNEFILDPCIDPRTGHEGRLLRKKENHARRSGITVHEYLMQNTELEKSLQDMITSWLRGRHGPQLFMSHITAFADRFNERWFYAQQGHTLLGACLLNRMEARQGWVLTFLMATPEAPNGTTELLLLTVLETLQREACRFFTLGIAVAVQLEQTIGLGKFHKWFVRNIFKIIKKIFHLNRRTIYWKKFQPQSEPAYLLFSQSRLSLRVILAIILAFNASLISKK